jgi:glucokinase
MILAGDFGGTKCNLALFRSGGGNFEMIARKQYLCRDFPTPEMIIRDFLAQHGARRLSCIGFSVAGPVFEGDVEFVNLPWTMSTKRLKRILNVDRAVLVNDLVATLYGIDLLSPSDFYSLQRGSRIEHGTRAIIGVGTGMNEMIAFWDHHQREYVAIPSESGHADFAPRDQNEIELLKWLKKKHKNVSWQMILTGKGLSLVHEFLGPAMNHGRPVVDEKPEVISNNARVRKCTVCVRTMELWASMYGAEAGNVALRSLARGGIFLTGSVTLAGLHNRGRKQFVKAFSQKAKLRDVLKGVPVDLVLNADAPLLGAAYAATRNQP